ncbi:MAG: restriction endonuclease [Bacteroidota bacterium]
MPKKTNLDWKIYESITKYIYETLGRKTGVKILGFGSNCKVPGKSGVNHQIDILTTHSDGIHSYKTAIECKYWKKKINKEIVMKVSETIEDAGIEKGVIVSKSGFTKDGAEFAKYQNIGIVELKEIGETVQDIQERQLNIGSIEISSFVTILRPEILSIEIEYFENGSIEKEIINITTISLLDGRSKPFNDYSKAFQNELHVHNKIGETITKRYEILSGGLIHKKENPPAKIKSIIFTGVLNQINSNSTRTFSLVDEVWLTMKSLFEGKSFSISENGFIVENNK